MGRGGVSKGQEEHLDSDREPRVSGVLTRPSLAGVHN